MLSEDTQKQIQRIPGREGWYKSDGCASYLALAEQMVSRGLTEQEAVDILDSAYCTAAEEFGC